jgi:hypothetical protein
MQGAILLTAAERSDQIADDLGTMAHDLVRAGSHAVHRHRLGRAAVAHARPPHAVPHMHRAVHRAWYRVR